MAIVVILKLKLILSYSINTDNISLNQWLNMWGKLCHGAAGISGFPIWVQLLGHLFFDTIDRDGKYRVSQQVLDENFVSIKFREIKF